MIDWDKQALRLNPENGFFIKKWDGGNSDTVLGELAEFLRGTAEPLSWITSTNSLPQSLV